MFCYQCEQTAAGKACTRMGVCGKPPDVADLQDLLSYLATGVSVFLSLLHLGVRNMRLGPSLPAFISPPVLEVLVKEYGLAPVTTPEQDLAVMLA